MWWKKWKFCRAMLSPLKELNRNINNKILKRFDKEMPLYIYWGISGKSHIWAAFIHSKYKYKRSYIILDFSTYFEQITYDIVVNSLKKLWICNSRTAEIIAELWCVVKWKEIINSWEKVIARWFSTSSRLAIFWSLKFFKKLNNLLHKELKWKKHEISIFIDDITISFDNICKNNIINLLSKIENLFNKEWFKFNLEKTKWYRDIEEIEVLWILVKRWNIDITKSFKEKINNWYRELSKSKTLKEKNNSYRKIKWMKQYKINVNKHNNK